VGYAAHPNDFQVLPPRTVTTIRSYQHVSDPPHRRTTLFLPRVGAKYLGVERAPRPQDGAIRSRSARRLRLRRGPHPEAVESTTPLHAPCRPTMD